MRWFALGLTIGCGTTGGPGVIDASEAAVDAAPEAGVCNYTRDNGDQVVCLSTDVACPDPNLACGNDCTCEPSPPSTDYLLTCTPDKCGADAGAD